MGLDANNPQHTVALKEAMSGIENQEAFLDYCRNAKNGIEYETKVEKLDTLATRYKKNQELNALPLDMLKAFSRKLYQKFTDAIYVIRDHEAFLSSKGLQQLKLNKQQLFTLKEIEVLNAVGSLSYLISLYELHRLKEAIYETCVKKSLLKRRAEKQLGNKSDSAKRVLAIVSGVGRAG